MRLSRRAAIVLGLALGALVLEAAPMPQQTVATAEAAEVEAAELKAAYVVNFARYAEWPASRFEHATSPLTVVVIGDDRVAEELEAIARRADPIGGHPLEVRSLRLSPPESWRRREMLAEIRRAHMVYIGPGAEDGAPELIADLSGVPVLTVGDVPGFAARGGMIGLRQRERRVVFDANPEAIKQSGLTVSARLLKLASIVGTGEDR